jgi:hypothetical protein
LGQLSELHSKLLELRLQARAVATDRAEEPYATRSGLESRALADATEHLWRVLDALYGKANFNPNQPRVPRGNPDGGQWTDDPAHGGGEGRLQTGRSATRRRPPRRLREPRQPGVRVTITPKPEGWRASGEPPPRGDNSGFPDPLTSELPDVPVERPPTAKERHRIVKTIARIGFRLIRAASPLGRLMDLFEIGSWLYEEFAPHLEAYWDDPKSLEELRRNARFPAKGYDIHHVNEYTASKKAGFSDELVDGPENLVRISRLMHWRITAYFQTPNRKFGGLTPRQHVAKMKTWHERTKFGLDVLREFEVLK